MLLLLTAAVLLNPEVDATPPRPPAIGATIADFNLPDIHRRPRSLLGLGPKKAFVVVFTGTECPLANLYIPTLVELHEAYAGKEVQFLAINSNSQDSFNQVSAHAQARGIPFPVLKDFDQRAADAFGAKRTPEVFLLDAQRVIRYHGRIDDQYGIGYQRDNPTRRDLALALEAVLEGKPPEVAQTQIPGCIIGRAANARRAKEVTYARHVARILQQHCQECHRPEEIGPMSLLTADDAKAWAQTIREVVVEERMPPWYAHTEPGRFSNERGLSSAEKETLLSWIDQGCPEGDPQDLPPPRSFPAGWKIGQPDAVYEMPEEYAVPAKGVLPYLKFTVDPGFSEDVWVQAAECRPGNRAVVHHILVYIQAAGRPIYAEDGTAAMLAGWAPGDMPAIYEEGTAKRIPKGAKLVFEVHYTPNGLAQNDRSRVGVIFAKARPKHEVQCNIMANMGLKVPARAARHEARFNFTFRADARILSFMPHMHLRGTSAKYVATFPDGRQETLLAVPDYNFNWQSVYRFKEPLLAPKGTRIAWIGTWDNSADNPRNPDAERDVRWGLQTWDEMQNGWMEFVWSDPAER
jgi:peroxiredoxin